MKAPGAERGDGAGAGTPVEDAARGVLARQLREVAKLLPRAAREKPGTPGGVKGVHALRVATRRACAALEVFGPLLPGKEGRKIAKRLRTIRRTAGAARDQDVHAEILAGALTHVRDAAQRAALRAVLSDTRRRRKAAQRPLIELARRLPAGELRARFDAGVESLGRGGRAGALGRTLADAARRVLAERVAKVRGVVAADLHDIEAVHALRLELKHLRYGAEIFAHCLGTPWRARLGPALAEVQGLLGGINDTHVLLGTLRAFRKARREGKKPAGQAAEASVGEGLDSLISGLKSRLAADHRGFLARWEEFSAAGFFESLLAAAAPPAGDAGADAPAPPAAAAVVAALNGHLVEPKPPAAPGPRAARVPRAVRRRIAAIDVGTNSVRLIVAEVGPDGSYRVLDDEKEVTRLGRGLSATGRMDPAAVEHTADTIARMRAIADGYGVYEIQAVGTAAAREAANAALLSRLVRERAGLELRVISGDEEAALAYRSAARAFDFSGVPALVVDIGGGSTEMVLSVPAGGAEKPGPHMGGVIERVYTLPLGAVRLTEMFGGPEACAGKRFEEMRRHIRRALKAAVGTPPSVPQLVVGTGGSFTTLGAMAMIRERGDGPDGLFSAGVQGHEVRRPDLKHLLDHVRKLPVKERARVPGLGADRADIIVAGLAVMDGVLKRFGANAVRVHEGGIRDGLLLGMASAGQDALGTSPAASGIDPMKGVRRFAKACGYEAAHARHVTRLALDLFDQLGAQLSPDAGTHAGGRKVPKSPSLLDFGAEARLLLEAASLLHDVGYLINYAQHHKHSLHLIMHAGLPGLSVRQVRVIANVARYHRAAEPKAKHPAFSALGEGDRALVRQLAAILRVADGLDRTHTQNVQSVRLGLGKGSAELHVTAEREPSVDLWGAARKSGLFKSVIGVPLELHWTERGGSESAPETTDARAPLSGARR